jgi:hypothetical protein
VTDNLTDGQTVRRLPYDCRRMISVFLSLSVGPYSECNSELNPNRRIRADCGVEVGRENGRIRELDKVVYTVEK